MPLAPSCLPRIVKVDSTCGCTLTAPNIRGLTPDEFEALQNKEIDLARVILNAAEAKAYGIREKGIAALLKSSIKAIKKPAFSTTSIDEQSIVLPYIQRTQTSVINDQYFTIEAGTAGAGAGTGDIHPGLWQVTLNLGESWLKTDIEAIERYFKPGMTLVVLTWDNTTDKNAKTLVFTIKGATNADSGGVKKAHVLLEPNITSAGFLALANDAAGRGRYRPTFGVAQIGANSINDREVWCQNLPTNFSKRIVVNWIQTSRESRCVDDEHKRMLDLILKGKVNEFQRGLAGRTSIAEQNKKAAQLSENAWLLSVFYGQKINEHQNPNTYELLPQVFDPSDTNCPLGFKANALGIFTLLQDCNRVMDFNGGPLELEVIWEEAAKLKRHRDGDGDSVQVIDSMTDRLTAARILDTMIIYYKRKLNTETHRSLKVNEKITHDNLVLFNYNIYDLPDQGIQWAVFHDTFFDDFLSAFPATVGGESFKARGRQLLFIDWSDIQIGIAGTMSVQRRKPDEKTSDLYQCVMLANHQTINLRSQKWTVMVDRPQRHLIVYNFSADCPIVGVTGCTVPVSIP